MHWRCTVFVSDYQSVHFVSLASGGSLVTLLWAEEKVAWEGCLLACSLKPGTMEWCNVQHRNIHIILYPLHSLYS